MSSYDRASDIKAFDETKAGVKGLVDAGVASIPRFFHTKIEEAAADLNTSFSIPVVDLQAGRDGVVSVVKRATETYGFFQVVNHGIPVEVLDEMREGVKRFNEQDTETKMKYYTRDPSRKVLYNSNFDLYSAPAANWRDTLFLVMASAPPEPEDFPIVCRDIIIQFSSHVQKLGRTLFQLLSEALGLESNRLEEMGCAAGLTKGMHYYPPCPQPHLTLGTSKHSDPGFLTVLMQDHIGGLQVLHQNQWVDVPPLPGALVINIGDLLLVYT